MQWVYVHYVNTDMVLPLLKTTASARPPSTTMAGFCVFVDGRVGVAAENAADSREV